MERVTSLHHRHALNKIVHTSGEKTQFSHLLAGLFVEHLTSLYINTMSVCTFACFPNTFLLKRIQLLGQTGLPVCQLEFTMIMYRIAKVGKDPQDHPVQPFALHQWFSLNHVPQHNIQTLFEHQQARWLHHLSGQPIPVPDHPFREVVFPNVQPESSLEQLEAIPSSPRSPYLINSTEILSYSSITQVLFSESVLKIYHNVGDVR